MVTLFKWRKSKKLFIPFNNSEEVGGPNTFMGNLQKYLDKKGFKYLTSADDAQAIFFPISYDLSTLEKIKSRGGKIIQRLDGVYYQEKHGDNYRSQNQKIEQVYKHLADKVIFQSDYSRKQCFAVLDHKQESDYEIIINGADREIFHPNSKSESDNLGKTVRLLTTGNFRNLDMLEPIVLAIDSLPGKSHKIELTVAGPITNPALEPLLNRPYINYAGKLSLEQIADALREHDLFLYSHLNPPCPNSVIEAVSTGIPVVGFASGAMEELLSFNKELLAFVSEDVLQNYSQFKFQALAEKILYAVDNYQEIKQAAMDNTSLYDFDDCGQAYLNIFTSYL